MSEVRSRRHWVPIGLAAVLVICLGRPERLALAAEQSAQRELELTNIHTGEVVKAKFRDSHDIDAQTIANLQHLLRDYRLNEQHEMDPELFVLLSDIASEAGCEPKYDVISAYRSPATNAQLHAAGHAVAEHSLHMEGRAMDVRLKGCALTRLRDTALAAKRGGVGFYPRSNFVHVDTGRVRSWQE
jgi:uncharacterized protein YcbK (DUF882 family)